MDAKTASVVKEMETETSISAIGDIVGSYDEISAIAIESGSLASHLVNGLRVEGFPAVIVDARHAAPFLREYDARKVIEMMHTQSPNLYAQMLTGRYG